MTDLAPAELVRLSRFLEAHREHFALALIQATRFDVRDDLATWAEDFCREHSRPFRIVDGLGLEVIEVWERIAQPVPTGAIVMLVGLDGALLDGQRELASLLNRQRERIAQILRGPVLLVLGESALDRFRADAPDLADFYSASFEFEPEMESLEFARPASRMESGLSREAIESRIALLEGQASGAVSEEVRGRIWSEVARLYRELGQYPKAEALFRKALELALRLGPDHPDVAVGRSSLANILGDLGEYAEARKQIELALESDLRRFGPDHSAVAMDRSNLAAILGGLGEHAEARRQIELALESDLRVFGPDHTNVTVDRSYLANVLGSLGELAEARKQIELALESDLRVFGPDHPTVAVRRSNLANLLGELGELAAARKQIELALNSDLRQFGPDHPAVAIDRSKLAGTLYNSGEREAALREIDQALEIFRQKLPPEHPNIRAAEQWRNRILRSAQR